MNWENSAVIHDHNSGFMVTLTLHTFIMLTLPIAISFFPSSEDLKAACRVRMATGSR
jgi:hypothetical protein